jgi:hypothetical protein
MLDRALVAIVLALLGYLERRGVSTAIDADPDRARLGRAGSRLREWLRESNGVRPGGKPDADRPVEPDTRVPPD